MRWLSGAEWCRADNRIDLNNKLRGIKDDGWELSGEENRPRNSSLMVGADLEARTRLWVTSVEPYMEYVLKHIRLSYRGIRRELASRRYHYKSNERNLAVIGFMGVKRVAGGENCLILYVPEMIISRRLR